MNRGVVDCNPNRECLHGNGKRETMSNAPGLVAVSRALLE